MRHFAERTEEILLQVPRKKTPPLHEIPHPQRNPGRARLKQDYFRTLPPSGTGLHGKRTPPGTGTTDTASLCAQQYPQREKTGRYGPSESRCAIEQGILSNTTNQRLHALETKQEELERLAIIEKSKLAVTLSEETVREFYTQALRLEPQLLIDCLVKEIVLYDDKIEIYFNSPIQPSNEDGSPDESQGFVFYSEDVRLLLKDPHRSQPIRIEAKVEMRI